jgi:hypothetical protein
MERISAEVAHADARGHFRLGREHLPGLEIALQDVFLDSLNGLFDLVGGADRFQVFHRLLMISRRGLRYLYSAPHNPVKRISPPWSIKRRQILYIYKEGEKQG